MPAAPVLAPRTVRTVRVGDPGPLLHLLPGSDALAWVRGGAGLVGWGVAARVTLTGADAFEAAQRWWQDLLAGVQVHDEVGLPGCGPVAFGSFAFDGASSPSVLVVPRVVVGARDGTFWLTTFGVDPPDPPEPAPASEPVAPGPVRFSDGALPSARWAQVVADAVRRIAAGEVDKVVLARDLEARTDEPIDLRWPLRRLAEGYPECWTFAVDGLLGATPEMLVRLEKGVASSRVLAGTVRRTGDDARDVAHAASLARSSKDLEEHEYGVRSVAQALERHCALVEVPAEPFVLHLPNVMHLATDITAVVTDASTSLGLVQSLHPSAAVCGTPTDVARELIREVEGMDRGRYAGPVGWMDAGGDGEWGIALRCAAVDPADPAMLRLFAGCGIVAASRPEEELAESVAKLVPMRDALQA